MYKKFLLLISLLYVNIAMALECPAGQYFVSAHARRSYYRADGTFVSATNVLDHCRPYQFLSPLKIKFQNTMPKGWPYLEKFKGWMAIEKKEIERALNSLPERLENLGEIKIYRATKSAFPDNPTTSGPDESIIVLYDSVKDFGYKQALAHEMAHILFAKLSRDEKEEYYAFSEWESDYGKLFTIRKDFSEPDGRLTPEEDFANNIEYVVIKNGQRINSKILKYLNSLMGIKK